MNAARFLLSLSTLMVWGGVGAQEGDDNKKNY